MNVISQHQHDNFHLIRRSEIETQLNNFRGNQFESNTVKISSSRSVKMSNKTEFEDLEKKMRRYNKERIQ
jgi:hypothetical protein